MDTPASLLERLRQPEAAGAWTRFVELYTPLLFAWAGRLGLQEADAADLVQEVLLALHRTLPAFVYDPHRRFRHWLRTVLVNKHRENLRRRQPCVVDAQGPLLSNLASADDVEVLADSEYRQYVAVRALELIQGQFPAVTWKACWETLVCDRPVAEVAAELGLTTSAVYIARFRVLRWLRAELAGLLD